MLLPPALVGGPTPTWSHRERVAVVKNVGERLAYVKNSMPPLFTFDCICLPDGLFGGALEVEVTQRVLSPCT